MLALPWKLNWRSAATPACYQKVCFHTKHLQQIYRFISPGVHLLGKISTNVEFIGDTGYAPMEMETGFAVGTDKVRGQGGWKKGNTLALFRVASHTKCFDHICYTKYQLLLLILMTKHIYRKFSKLDANKLGKHLLSTKFVAPKLNISGSVKCEISFVGIPCQKDGLRQGSGGSLLNWKSATNPTATNLPLPTTYASTSTIQVLYTCTTHLLNTSQKVWIVWHILLRSS